MTMSDPGPGPNSDDFAILLSLIYRDLHPAYGSTARRGRGIGGQMVTQQCNVLDPEGWEFAAIDEIERVLRARFEQEDGVEFQKKIEAKIAELKKVEGWWNPRPATDDFGPLPEDVTIQVFYSDRQHSTVRVTHKPTGITASAMQANGEELVEVRKRALAKLKELLGE